MKSICGGIWSKINVQTGQTNVVADALSRQFCFNLSTESSDINSMHSASSSPNIDIIKRVPIPLNCYKNQFVLKKSPINSSRSVTVFPGYVLHTIKFTNSLNSLATTLSPSKINAIFSTEEIFYFIKDHLVDGFPQIKFVFTAICSKCYRP